MSGGERGEHVIHAWQAGQIGPVEPSAPGRGDRPGAPDARAPKSHDATPVELANDRLEQLLVEHVNTGAITRVAFAKIAAASGWRYEDRDGVLVALDDSQRVVAAAAARAAPSGTWRPLTSARVVGRRSGMPRRPGAAGGRLFSGSVQPVIALDASQPRDANRD